MATIERRGDGWRVRWRDPDGKARSRQCPSARSARELKLSVEEAGATGKRWAPSATVRVPALRDLIAAYLGDLLRVREASTHRRAHYALDPFNEWVRARLRLSVPTVDVLTRSLLEAFDAHQVQLGNSPATRRASMWAVGSAWRWGWSHPEWRAALNEPSIPRMPAALARRTEAATWAQLDAVVHLAENKARGSKRVWLHRLVLLMRGLGWRVKQCIALDAEDYDEARGAMTLRPELGKSGAEKAGRTVPVAPWLRPLVKAWARDGGPLIGRSVHRATAAREVRALWQASGAPEKLWRQRPDHAFRIGLISGLTVARADREAVEYYVGHVLAGMRGPYVDPSTLALDEVAALIPAVGPRVREVSEGASPSVSTSRKHKAKL